MDGRAKARGRRITTDRTTIPCCIPNCLNRREHNRWIIFGGVRKPSCHPCYAVLGKRFGYGRSYPKTITLYDMYSSMYATERRMRCAVCGDLTDDPDDPHILCDHKHPHPCAHIVHVRCAKVDGPLEPLHYFCLEHTGDGETLENCVLLRALPETGGKIYVEKQSLLLFQKTRVELEEQTDTTDSDDEGLLLYTPTRGEVFPYGDDSAMEGRLQEIDEDDLVEDGIAQDSGQHCSSNLILGGADALDSHDLAGQTAFRGIYHEDALIPPEIPESPSEDLSQNRTIQRTTSLEWLQQLNQERAHSAAHLDAPPPPDFNPVGNEDPQLESDKFWEEVFAVLGEIDHEDAQLENDRFWEEVIAVQGEIDQANTFVAGSYDELLLN